MEKPAYRILAIFFLAATLVACAPSQPSGNSETPNIILIISDDQSWTDYSFLGHEHIETPNIDRLQQRA